MVSSVYLYLLLPPRNSFIAGKEGKDVIFFPFKSLVSYSSNIYKLHSGIKLYSLFPLCSNATLFVTKFLKVFESTSVLLIYLPMNSFNL